MADASGPADHDDEMEEVESPTPLSPALSSPVSPQLLSSGLADSSRGVTNSGDHSYALESGSVGGGSLLSPPTSLPSHLSSPLASFGSTHSSPSPSHGAVRPPQHQRQASLMLPPTPNALLHTSTAASAASFTAASHSSARARMLAARSATMRSPMQGALSPASIASPSGSLLSPTPTPSSSSSMLDRRPSFLHVPEMYGSPLNGDAGQAQQANFRATTTRHHQRTPSLALFSPATTTAAAQQRSNMMRRGSIGPLTTSRIHVQQAPQTTVISAASASSARPSSLSRQPSIGNLLPTGVGAGAQAAAAAPSSSAEPVYHYDPAFSQPSALHHQRLASMFAGGGDAYAFSPSADLRDTNLDQDQLMQDMLSSGDVVDLDLSGHLDAQGLAKLAADEARRVRSLERMFHLIFILALLCNFDCGVIPACLASMKADIPSFTFATLGLLCSLNFLGLVIGGFVSGPLLERMHQPRLLTLCLGLQALLVFVLGAVPNVGLMVFSRFAIGLVQAPLVVFAPAWIAKHAPSPTVHDVWTTMLHVANPLGMALGFVVGVVASVQADDSDLDDLEADEVNDDRPWQWAFFIQSFLLLPLALSLVFLPRRLVSTKTLDRSPEDVAIERAVRAQDAAWMAEAQQTKWLEQHAKTVPSFDTQPPSHLSIQVSASPPASTRAGSKWSKLPSSSTVGGSISSVTPVLNAPPTATRLASFQPLSAATSTRAALGGSGRRASLSDAATLLSSANAAATTSANAATVTAPGPVWLRTDTDGVAMAPATTTLALPFPSPLYAADAVEIGSTSHEAPSMASAMGETTYPASALFDSMDLASMFSPRHRVITWAWKPEGREVTSDPWSRPAEDEAPLTTSQLLMALIGQVKLVGSNHLFVAMVGVLCCLYFLLTAVHFWMTTWALATFSLDLSVSGLAYVLVASIATPLGVLGGRSAMQRLEARLDERYDRELLAAAAASGPAGRGGASATTLHAFLKVAATSDDTRAGPLFDTVGRKNRQLVKGVFALIAILTTILGLMATIIGLSGALGAADASTTRLLASGSASTGGAIVAFIGLFGLLLTGGALVPLCAWILDGAVWARGDDGDVAACALAVAQLAFNLLGYFLAPVLVGVAMDSSSTNTTGGFTLALAWTIPLAACVCVAAILQWRECAHQRAMEDVQRSVFLSLGGGGLVPAPSPLELDIDDQDEQDDEHDNDNPALSPPRASRHLGGSSFGRDGGGSTTRPVQATSPTPPATPMPARRDCCPPPTGAMAPEDIPTWSRRGSLAGYEPTAIDFSHISSSFGGRGDGGSSGSEPPSPPQTVHAVWSTPDDAREEGEFEEDEEEYSLYTRS